MTVRFPNPKGKTVGAILLLNEKGDEPVAEWTVGSKEEVDAAFAVLTEQLAEGGKMAYAVEGDSRTQIKASDSRADFPETAEKIVIVPALQGG